MGKRMRPVNMLKTKFQLCCQHSEQIYGRPSAPLKKVRVLGNIQGVLELAWANLIKSKPYVLRYTLKKC